jgi:hypothetical protein
MIAIDIYFVESMIQAWDNDLDKLLASRKKKILNILRGGKKKFTKRQIEYLSYLEKNLKAIVIASPHALSRLKKEFPPSALKAKRGYKPKVCFKDKVVEALNYTGFRSSFLPKYFHSIGIKSCVYCNSLLTISIKDTEGISARFETDHFIPKADYPSFSISLFNFYPVCGPCNKAKGRKTLSFKLYSGKAMETSNSNVQFKLKKGVVAKFLVTNEHDDLDFDFVEKKQVGKSVGELQEHFGIKEIYETQKDVLEELIVKSQVYSPKYKESLVKKFKRIFPDAGLSNRILIGNYTDPKDIHKRPLAKFTMDMARELKLIK